MPLELHCSCMESLVFLKKKNAFFIKGAIIFTGRGAVYLWGDQTFFGGDQFFSLGQMGAEFLRGPRVRTRIFFKRGNQTFYVRGELYSFMGDHNFFP